MHFKRISLYFIGGTILAISLLFSLYHLSRSRDFQVFGNIVSRVETTKKVVALTFDDAPTPNTSQVLNVLREKDVKATFYAIGKNIELFPDLAKQIVTEGHELGNHSYSHKRIVFKPLSFIEHEVSSTNALIHGLGQSKITFRPPYGKKLFLLPWYLEQQGMLTVMCDVEPDTFYGGDAPGMVQYTLSTTKPGSVILLHPLCGDGCSAAREALPLIIDGLKADGYEFVTISELLEYK